MLHASFFASCWAGSQRWLQVFDHQNKSAWRDRTCATHTSQDLQESVNDNHRCLFACAGVSSQLQENSRDLLWDEFTAAKVQVGTVKHAEVSNTEADQHSGDLCTYNLQIDFGNSTGVQKAVAVLNSKVFETSQALLDRQVLAVVNLSDNLSAATVSVVSVAGKAVLQPAKQVDNGYILA